MVSARATNPPALRGSHHASSRLRGSSISHHGRRSVGHPATAQILPPEVLLRIFHMLKPDPSYASVEVSLHNLITITHICFHFRAVALADPTLWDVVMFGDVASPTALLGRSLILPLVIVSKPAVGPGTSLLEVLEKTLRSRTVRELHLSHPAPVLDRLVTRFMDVALRDLQALSLTCLCGPQGATRYAYDVPHSFLHREAVSVQRLAFSGCTLQWDFPDFGRLSTFELASVPSITRPTRADLVDALNHMPYLEELVLDDALPRSQLERGMPLSSRARLDNLRLLRLVGDSNDVAAALQLLRFPASAKIHLRCADAARAGVINPATHDVLKVVRKQVVDKSDADPLWSLAFHNLKPGRLRVVGYSRSQGSSAPCRGDYDESPRNSARLCITLEWSSDRMPVRKNAISVAGSALCSSSLRAVFVSDAACPDGVFWLGFPDLEIIGAQRECALGLISVLGAMAPTGDKKPKAKAFGHTHTAPLSKSHSRAGSLSFPNLCVLILEDVDFSWETEPGQTAGDDLERQLTHRESLGMRLQELEIRGCQAVQHRLLHFLRGSVRSVGWDGEGLLKC